MAGPIGLLSFLQVSSPVGFPDLPGCADKRSKQLKKDQSHFAEDLSLVCRLESLPLMGLDRIPIESCGWSKQAF